MRLEESRIPRTVCGGIETEASVRVAPELGFVQRQSWERHKQASEEHRTGALKPFTGSEASFVEVRAVSHMGIPERDRQEF
jgi:hypothetical protein